jgi:hypothetical protein
MISLCCPSRGRPELAARMVRTALETVSSIGKIEFLFYLNEDDPKLEEYKQRLDSAYYTVGPHQSTCYSWNQLAERAKGDLVFLMGDDAQFLTKDWDIEIEKIFDQHPDKICMVSPWDCNTKGKGWEHKDKTEPVYVKDEQIGAPHFVLHKNWIRTLGYFVPPFFWHWYVDTYTQAVSRKLNRCILLPYVHLKAKKIFDETAKEIRSKNSVDKRDDWVWSKVKGRHLDTDVALLKNFIDTFKS